MSKKRKGKKWGAPVSTVSGAGAGAIGAISGVVTGAAEGTAGAAMMTSGLATVGSIIGGGMFAGMCVLTVAPIVGGAAGYGCYRLFKKLATPEGQSQKKKQVTSDLNTSRG